MQLSNLDVIILIIVALSALLAFYNRMGTFDHFDDSRITAFDSAV